MKTIIFTLVTRGLLFLSGMLSSILTARLLSPTDRGVFFYWSVIANLFIQFGNLGFPVSNIYLYGKKLANISELFVNSVYISIVSSIVMAIIVSLFFDFTLSDFVLIALFILLSIYFLFLQNLFVAEQKFGIYNWLELANRCLSIALLGGLVYLYHSPTSGYLAMVLALAAVALVATVILFKSLEINSKSFRKLIKFNPAPFLIGIKFSFKSYLTLVLSYAFIRFNSFFIKSYFTGVDLGVWSIAIQIFETLTIIPITFAFLVYPKLIVAKDPYKMLLNQIKIVSFLMIVALIALWFFGDYAITLLYGANYSDSFHILRFGMPAIFAFSLVSLYSQYISAMNLPKRQIVNWTIALLVQILMILWMKSRYGLEGIMLAISVSTILLLFLMWLLARKIQKQSVADSNQSDTMVLTA